MYCNKFFKTKAEAKSFQKSHGGVFYSNELESHTKSSYLTEALMMGHGEAFREEHPYVIAWNEN